MLSFAPQRQLPMRRLSTIGALGEASSRCPTSCILVIEEEHIQKQGGAITALS